MDRTLAFYEDVLGFGAVRCDIIKVKEGGQIRHVFFDTGAASSSPSWSRTTSPAWPRSSTPASTAAWGSRTGSITSPSRPAPPTELEAKRAELIAKGVKVTPVVDHEWAKSIYFKDPNGVFLEYCCYTRAFNEDDARMQPRFEMQPGMNRA